MKNNIIAIITIIFMGYIASIDNCCAGNESLPSFITNNLLFSFGRVSFSGGDGHNYEQSIVINGARSEAIGVAAETEWLENHYPGFRKQRQELHSLEEKNRHYDVIEMSISNKIVNVYFDITEYYGKEDVGQWRFRDVNGRVFAGIIKDSDVPVDDSQPWRFVISNSTGELTYQFDYRYDNGHFCTGPVIKGERSGMWTNYVNGVGEFHVWLENGKRNGSEVFWSTNGIKRFEFNWKDGKWDGWLRWWYDNGSNSMERHYKNGKRNGEAKSWYTNGVKSSECIFENDKLISETRWDETGKRMRRNHKGSTSPSSFTPDIRVTGHKGHVSTTDKSTP